MDDAPQVSEDRKDAGRYRWLRSIGGQVWHMVDDPKYPVKATDEYYDSVVDQAIQEGEVMSLTAFKGRCPHCGHDHGQNTFEVALGTLTPSEQARLDEQFANYAKQKPHLYGGQAMSISPSYVDGLELRIKELGEKVEKLKAELKSIDGALNDPRANLTLTTSEIIWELKGQLAALAEQNEKMRAFLNFAWKDIPMSEYAFEILEHAMNLPNLASPVLNRIRAEGMRLDWLEAHPEFSLRKHKKHWVCAPFTNYEFNAYKTIREAIDAAIDGSWQSQ